MWHSSAASLQPTATPTRIALQGIATPTTQPSRLAVGVAPSLAPSGPWTRCPAHSPISPTQPAAWGVLGPCRLTCQRTATRASAAAGAGAEAEARAGGANRSSVKSSGGGSGSSSGSLQPKPQAKYRRLSPAGQGSAYAPSKPRRWHKAAPPSPSPQPGVASEPLQPQQHLDQSAAAPPATETALRDRQPQQRRQQQKPQRGRGRQEEQPRGAGGRGRRRDVYDDDAYDDEDEDEDDDGELLGLSEEELEAMVFASAATSSSAGAGASASPAPASAAAAAATAAAPGKQRRQAGKGGGAAASSSLSTADAVAAAGLPTELEVHVHAAVRSGSVSNDSGILADQLRQLRETAAAAAAATDSAAAADVLVASVTATADLLGCSAEAATAVLINYPRYVGIVSGGAAASGEATERLRSFAGLLKLDLAEARDVVRRNPALLLVPYEPLRQKLTALANATGLSLAQATAMITPYMFPEL